MSLRSLFRREPSGPGIRISEAEFVSNHLDDGVVIDVRTPREFADAHIVGARNLDIMSQSFGTEVSSLPNKGKYYLYCRSGSRSHRAAQVMRQMGYDAYNVGGLQALAGAGAPLER